MLYLAFFVQMQHMSKEKPVQDVAAPAANPVYLNACRHSQTTLLFVHAITLDRMQVLHRIEDLERRASQAEVMVVGAGYAGVELASTVAERLGFKGRVKLVSAGNAV